MNDWIIAVLCFATGAVIAWLLASIRSAALRSRVAPLDAEIKSARKQIVEQMEMNAQLRESVAALKSTLAQEQKNASEKLDLLNRATDELRGAFQALAAEALKSNNQSFLDLAKTSLEKFQTHAKDDLAARQQAVEHLVAPIKESLGKVDEQIRQIETQRSEAYGSLSQQVQSLISTQEQLRSETGNLVKALRAPSVRGRWGEIQLKRVVEVAGMTSYCDFSEQETIHSNEGRLRPDLIVKLPGGKRIIVDAKTPLEAYLRAIETADDDSRRAQLQTHARQVRDHMAKLGSKSYWAQFESSPEFVVMFLPGETFFSAALEQDPALIEEGVGMQVIPASPTTLIALLRAVAYGWRQEKLARNAQEISALGKEMHDRLRTLAAHMESAGRNLDRAVESYNKAIGTLESRVLVSARKFGELGAPITDAIQELEPVETTSRTLALDWGEEEGEQIPEKNSQSASASGNSS